MQSQSQTLWCWAAVASSIRGFFRPAAPVNQCEIADAVLRVTDSCPLNPNRNVSALLEDALDAVGHYVSDNSVQLTFADLVAELDNNRPVCARIEWTTGKGHFVVVSGYAIAQSGEALVSVRDPAHANMPSTLVTFEEFSSDYRGGGGQWSDIYFLQP